MLWFTSWGGIRRAVFTTLAGQNCEPTNLCPVTATRDRRSDPETDAGPAWDERPIIGQFRGLPWWAAVSLAFGTTAIAAVIDMLRQDSLGMIYQGVFALGCVAAVCFVQRRSLFGPMVQAPLVFAITVVGAVAVFGQKIGEGLKSLVVSVALPLASNFLPMASTTAVVIGIGLFRLRRESDPNPKVRPNKPLNDRAARVVDGGLADEPEQSSDVRASRERSGPDRVVAPPRRGRPAPDDVPADEPAGRRVSTRGRPSREPGKRDAGDRDAGSREVSGRDAGARDVGGRAESGRDVGRRDAGDRDARRREAAAGRGERSRSEPSSDSGRGGRNRGGEPPARRRDSGADGGRTREERSSSRRGSGRESGGRDTGRDGRGDTAGRQPRRRPPEDSR
nr:hypothetical protein [uncultured organism]